VIADDAYVARLRALLTNPPPPGIDRYDGFGREVRVEGLHPVDDGPWPELEVSFRLALPDEPRYRDVPRTGTLRLPFGREWRELSRYADPAAYAPTIADATRDAARELVDTALRPRRRIDRDAVRAALPAREELWRDFLDVLAVHGEVREVAPGRLEVTPRDAGDLGRFWFLITPERLEEYVVDNGGHPDFMLDLDDTLGPRHDDEPYVLVDGHHLVTSMRDELPAVRGGIEVELIIQQVRESGQFGEWFAYPPDEER
jgi:hypothetical protein